MVVDIVQELKRDNPNLVYGRYSRPIKWRLVKVIHDSKTLFQSRGDGMFTSATWGFSYSAPAWQRCVILYFWGDDEDRSFIWRTDDQ